MSRARGMKLGRDVAIKVLPEGFTEDVERVVRIYQYHAFGSLLAHYQSTQT